MGFLLQPVLHSFMNTNHKTEEESAGFFCFDNINATLIITWQEEFRARLRSSLTAKYLFYFHIIASPHIILSGVFIFTFTLYKYDTDRCLGHDNM